MEILAELNEQATCKRVKLFFSKELPRLISASDKTPANIQSPTISDMPGGHGYGNSSESQVAEYIHANLVVDEVVRALNGMANDELAKMLKYKYIFGLSYYEVGERLRISRSKVFREMDEAYIQFAYSFRADDLKVKVK